MNTLTQVFKRFFSKQGRINRLQFFLLHLIPIGIFITSLFVLIHTDQLVFEYSQAEGFSILYSEEPMISTLIAYGFMFASLFSFFMITTKRLHDFNASGWWVSVAILGIIYPFLMALWLTCLFYPGSPDMNDFDLVV